MLELVNQCVVTKVSNGAAAGTSPVTSSILDMKGFDAVAFIADMGTCVSGGTVALAASENTVSSTSGGTTVSGGSTGTVTTGTASSNSTLALDCIRPSKRYVYATWTPTTSNAALNTIVAIQYRAKSVPTTQPASVMPVATSTPVV